METFSLITDIIRVNRIEMVETQLARAKRVFLRFERSNDHCIGQPMWQRAYNTLLYQVQNTLKAKLGMKLKETDRISPFQIQTKQ